MELPEKPSLEWLRKEAKRRLAEMRAKGPAAKLADAQFDLAKQYGFSSWRALKAHIDSMAIDGQLVAATREGDVDAVKRILDSHPEKLNLRIPPYDWPLLHLAAQHGRLTIVDLLLARGMDVNAREKGDNTYAMHWAAAHGHLDVVRRLADAGGDVIGAGDDHQLEVIGWSAFGKHRKVADFLVSRGARHHIFSAIAYDDADEVRRIVAADPSALQRRMSHNENGQMALHFAVRENKPEIVSLLLELGADPVATDSWGMPPAAYARNAQIDRPVMERIHASGETGFAAVLAALSLRDWERARVVPGALHLMSKRGDIDAVRWLLDHGADPSVRWAHWDSEVTPLHLAILGGHPDVVRLLHERGADPHIRDTKHDSDPIGWAEFFGQEQIANLLSGRTVKAFRRRQPCFAAAELRYSSPSPPRPSSRRQALRFIGHSTSLRAER